MSRPKRSEPAILFLGAGPLASHLELFRRYFRVYAADSDPLAASARVSDGIFVVPPFDDADFGPMLEGIIRKHGIHVVMPASHASLAALDGQRERVVAAGALPVICDSRTLRIAADKAQTFCFFISNDIPTLPLFAPDAEIPFPVCVRSADANGSERAFLARNRREMNFFCRTVPNAIIQRATEGEEYTIEVFADLDGRVLSAVPCRCIETRDGEVVKAVTVKDRSLIDHAVEIASTLGIVGPICIRAFREGTQAYFADIRCRFGSTATLASRAGADIARMLAAAVSGQHLDYDEDWQDGLLMVRAYRDFYLGIEELAQTAGIAGADEFPLPAGARS